MHERLTSEQHFAVNVLGASQRAVALTFARASGDRFSTIKALPGFNGVPLLAGAVAQLQCVRHEVHEGGDRAIVVGRVVAVEVPGGEPLIYGGGRFLDVGDANQTEAIEHDWLLSAPW
jgi:flavin reductase (DIM6/NTAB) family NADH-FMN oxidoreductase RutF